MKTLVAIILLTLATPALAQVVCKPLHCEQIGVDKAQVQKYEQHCADAYGVEIQAFGLDLTEFCTWGAAMRQSALEQGTNAASANLAGDHMVELLMKMKRTR